MITKELLKESYNAGIVKLVEDPNGHGTVCRIGQYWFYFGGLTAEENSPEAYIRDVPEEDILREIWETLNEFAQDFPTEYQYYESFLNECKALRDLQAPKLDTSQLRPFSDQQLISELINRGTVIDNFSIHVLLENAGYIGWVLWSRGDVAKKLIENGYKDTPENIDAVLNSGYLKHLSDCTEDGWETISTAIYYCDANLKAFQNITVHVYDIEWDTDGEDVDLPTSLDMKIREDMLDNIAEILSDKYFWCIKSLKTEILEGKKGEE